MVTEEYCYHCHGVGIKNELVLILSAVLSLKEEM